MRYIFTFIAGAGTLIVALIGWNYYDKNIRNADVYQSLGEGLSESLLRDAVLQAEQYKLIFGFYPNTISDLRGNSFHSDPASGKNCNNSTDFYYELDSNGNSYYLFSKGKDCKAFSSDDIFPVLNDKEKANVGLKYRD